MKVQVWALVLKAPVLVALVLVALVLAVQVWVAPALELHPADRQQAVAALTAARSSG